MNSNLLSMEEMNQYTFYSIPKELFENKEFEQLSIKARLLYTLMLDRLNLSKKYKWFDKEKRIYIYFTIKSAAKKWLRCSLRKCSDFFAELENIGLIQRKKQSFGKAMKIYVMNFNKKNTNNGEQKYNYFYAGDKKEEFNYIKMLKILFAENTLNDLSIDAKMLYSLMLDGLKVSYQSNWLDSKKNTYIYFKAEDVCKTLKCSKRKCTTLFKELKEAGLMLQKIQGKGNPAAIYLINLIQKLNIQLAKKVLKKKAYKRYVVRHAKYACWKTLKKVRQARKISICDNAKNDRSNKQNLQPNNNKFFKNNYFNNKLQQQRKKEPVVVVKKELLSFIKESLTQDELKAILSAANNNIQLIKEKYDIMKNQNVKSVVGFLIAAIKRNFQPAKSYTKVNKFINYEQRDWDFEKMERMERELLKKEAENIRKEKEEAINQNTYNQTLDEIKSKIHYDMLLNEFNKYKDKINTVINVLVKSICYDDLYIIYDGRCITKDKTEKTLKKLNYTHMKDVILNNFDKDIPDILIDLSKICA